MAEGEDPAGPFVISNLVIAAVHMVTLALIVRKQSGRHRVVASAR